MLVRDERRKGVTLRDVEAHRTEFRAGALSPLKADVQAQVQLAHKTDAAVAGRIGGTEIRGGRRGDDHVAIADELGELFG